MPELHWTEIDGVAVVWVETRGPLFGLLQFRSGVADETFATSGRTHLLEHLVMSTLLDPALPRNGFVGATATGFHANGRPEQVVDFLAGVCRALHALPLDRLDAEKKILAAEAAARGPNVLAHLLAWRFGAGGYGLLSLPEAGLEHATGEQLRSLAAERFTRGNAVLCLSGPPPPGVRLDLPPGPRHPPPAPSAALPALPTWTVDAHGGGVAASAMVPRVRAGPLLAALADERLRSRLRTEQALSYAPSVDYMPLTADQAHFAMFADATQDRRVELADSFLDVLQGLSEVTEVELAPIRRTMLVGFGDKKAMRPDDLALEEIHRASLGWLLGSPPEPVERLMAECAAAPAAEVAGLGSAIRAGALAILPGGATARDWMGQPVPRSTAGPVSGTEVPHLDAPVTATLLVHGAEGVTLRDPGGMATVRFDAMAGAFDYADGGLLLVARDGTMIPVEPTLWRGGPDVCRDVRSRIPATVLLPRQARATAEIPRPSTTPGQRMRARVTAAQPAAWGFVKTLTFLVAAMALVAITLYLILVPVAEGRAGLIGVLVYLLLLGGFYLWDRRTTA